MAELYDLMLLLDADAPDERQHEILAEARGMIDEQGVLVDAHDWGNRRLAFEIGHREEARYQLLQFEADRELLERLGNALRIMDGVVRFRIIRQKPGAPPVPESPAPMHAEDAEAGEEAADDSDGRVAARAAADASPDVDVDTLADETE